MIKTYSRRLLSPFVGVVQVVETAGAKARALSLDGRNWALQYAVTGDPQFRKRLSSAGPNLNFALVATIEGDALKTQAVHPFLEPKVVRSVVQRLFEAVSVASIPFAAADRYEYWLMDGRDEKPLALLHSGVDADDMATTPPRPVWSAMPAAQLAVQSPETDRDTYVPPVNYRLQKLVKQRAGTRPRALWFERPDSVTGDFPPCLIREDWENEERQQLCDRYIRRLAPRLLMLQGLSASVRHRLERAARDHVFDVERFHPLYPEVVDRRLLIAARVEARLRRGTEA